MTDIISAQNKLNDVEVSDGAAISQALMTKLGANINYLIDNQNNYQGLSLKSQVFTSNTTFTVPAGVTKLIVYGAGGGGGGAGGKRFLSGSTLRKYSGGGGAGAGLACVVLDVSPGQLKSVQIGNGGAGGAGGTSGGSGGTGGNSSFDTTIFYGAQGGLNAGNFLVAGVAYPSSGGGIGGEASRSGGAGTASAGGGSSGGGGGGGGYTGSGGNGGDNNSTVGTPGTNATGYGGGGGGGGYGDSFGASAGGAGSNGIIIVTYVGE